MYKVCLLLLLLLLLLNELALSYTSLLRESRNRAFSFSLSDTEAEGGGGNDLNQKSFESRRLAFSPLFADEKSFGDLVHSFDTSMTSFDVVSSSVTVESFFISCGSKRLKKPHLKKKLKYRNKIK